MVLTKKSEQKRSDCVCFAEISKLREGRFKFTLIFNLAIGHEYNRGL